MQVEAIPETIRTRPRPDCYLCGRRGVPLYRGLTDRLCGVPGRWDLNICSDPDCGLIWIDPVPTEEDIGKAYERVYYTHEPTTSGHPRLRRAFEAVKGGYLRSRLGYTRDVGPPWYRLLAPIAHLLPGGKDAIEAAVMFQGAPPPGAKVLDVGCGSGALLARMRAVGWDVEGVDFDPQAVEVARARGLTVHCGDLIRQEYPDAHFDVVHLGHVIEHVHDPLGLVRECRRILQPGGRLVLLTPNAGGWGHRHFDRDWYALDPPRHLHLFRVANLVEVVRRAGFVRVEARSLCRDARTVLVVSGMYRSYGLPWGELKGRYGLAWKVRGVLYQTWEQVLSLGRGQTGEEILCTAWKD
jgi:2-polyprenyl-3-methyl-5-hydroxy-6-metoxy-1,4-benzoquinol methylase